MEKIEKEGFTLKLFKHAEKRGETRERSPNPSTQNSSVGLA